MMPRRPKLPVFDESDMNIPASQSRPPILSAKHVRLLAPRRSPLRISDSKNIALSRGGVNQQRGGTGSETQATTADARGEEGLEAETEGDCEVSGAKRYVEVLLERIAAVEAELEQWKKNSHEAASPSSFHPASSSIERNIPSTHPPTDLYTSSNFTFALDGCGGKERASCTSCQRWKMTAGLIGVLVVVLWLRWRLEDERYGYEF